MEKVRRKKEKLETGYRKPDSGKEKKLIRKPGTERMG
jgi:hypothetical protein